MRGSILWQRFPMEHTSLTSKGGRRASPNIGFRFQGKSWVRKVWGGYSPYVSDPHHGPKGIYTTSRAAEGG